MMLFLGRIIVLGVEKQKDDNWNAVLCKRKGNMLFQYLRK